MSDERRMSWAEVCHYIAQGAINISEGKYNTFEAGSRVHRAMVEFCRLANERSILYRPKRWHMGSRDGECLGPHGLRILRVQRVGKTKRLGVRWELYHHDVRQSTHKKLKDAKEAAERILQDTGSARADPPPSLPAVRRHIVATKRHVVEQIQYYGAARVLGHWNGTDEEAIQAVHDDPREAFPVGHCDNQDERCYCLGHEDVYVPTVEIGD